MRCWGDSRDWVWLYLRLSHDHGTRRARLVGRLWFHHELASILRICTLNFVSYGYNQHDTIGSLTPSCVLSSYAAAKRIVSLGGFVSEVVVVVVVMFAEYCLWIAYLDAAIQSDSYITYRYTLTAA